MILINSFKKSFSEDLAAPIIFFQHFCMSLKFIVVLDNLNFYLILNLLNCGTVEKRISYILFFYTFINYLICEFSFIFVSPFSCSYFKKSFGIYICYESSQVLMSSYHDVVLYTFLFPITVMWSFIHYDSTSL